MSAEYSPLTPVYKNDQETIELDELPASTAAPSADRSDNESECERRWKNRRCCGTANESRGKRFVRCVVVTLAVVCAFWLIAGTATLSYLAVKAHRCLHPNYMEVVSYEFTPEKIKSVDLSMVAGKVTIRSCPKATNVTLTVRNYAATLELLQTMNIQTVVDEVHGVHTTAVKAPSFDWKHCQHTWVEVVVPQNAHVDIRARSEVGYFDVEVHENALRNVDLNSRVGGFSVRSSNVSGTVNIASSFGYIRVKELSASQGLFTDQGVGYLGVKGLDAAVMHSSLAVGHACVGNIEIDSLRVVSQIGYLSLWNVDAQNVTGIVEYGKLSLQVVPDFVGKFSAVSPYGFLSVDKGDSAPDFVFAKNDEAEISGTMGVAETVTNSQVIKADIEVVQARPLRDHELTSIYGAINFFVPNPHTSHWHEEHDESKN